MTVAIEFNRLEGGGIRSEWGQESRTINDLGEVRRLLEQYEEFDMDSVARLGLVSGLLAVRGLHHAGTPTSRSNIMRTLDEYDLVLPEENYHQAFQRGLEDAIEVARSDLEDFEELIWRRLS